MRIKIVGTDARTPADWCDFVDVLRVTKTTITTHKPFYVNSDRRWQRANGKPLPKDPFPLHMIEKESLDMINCVYDEKGKWR